MSGLRLNQLPRRKLHRFWLCLSEGAWALARSHRSTSCLQSGKTYRAAFCASPVALLVGPSNSASCNGWNERRTVYEDALRLIYLYFGQAWIFFGISLLRKQGSPCLLRGFLAYVFCGLLINKQYVKGVCGKIVSWYRNFLCTAGK